MNHLKNLPPKTPYFMFPLLILGLGFTLFWMGNPSGERSIAERDTLLMVFIRILKEDIDAPAGDITQSLINRGVFAKPLVIRDDAVYNQYGGTINVNNDKDTLMLISTGYTREVCADIVINLSLSGMYGRSDLFINGAIMPMQVMYGSGVVAAAGAACWKDSNSIAIAGEKIGFH